MMNVWRKMQIIVDPDIIERVFEWHGGQGSAAYALASTGQNNLVSLSMLDAAIEELESSDMDDDLERLVGDLDMVRQYWSEHSAENAGMDILEMEYEYDREDYGYEPDEEEEMSSQAAGTREIIAEGDGRGPTDEEMATGGRH